MTSALRRHANGTAGVRRAAALSAGVVALWWSVVSWADTVALTLPSGLAASAEYLAREPQRPAVLVVHGFLQARNYLTLTALANAAAAAGHSVLIPTLSLGIGNRSLSLPCEAVHEHTLERDLDELGVWLAWLAAKGYKEVVLVGHSFGSVHALAYATQRGNPRIKGVIATSLFGIDQDDAQWQVQIERARGLLQRNQGAVLDEYLLTYCQRYVAPAAAFMSYAVWTRSKIAEQVRRSPVPVAVILGSADRRMDPRWSKTLADSGAKVVLIQGANHFFDSQDEFDLMDAVQKLLPGNAPLP